MPTVRSRLDPRAPAAPAAAAAPRRPPLALAAFCLLALAGCAARDDGTRPGLVLEHGKLFGDPEPFEALLAEFTRATGVPVAHETLPASSDEQHQFYAVNLNARGHDFDVLALDVVWVAEFAEAGWLRDLTALLPETDRPAFFPGPVEAVTWRGRVFAIPWFVDVGLLYYRADLLAKHGLAPPRTWDELAAAAGTVIAREPGGLHGFVWQGKEYEGLVCNALEHVWGAGGEVLRDGRPVIGSPASVQALRRMRALIVPEGVTPDFVTTLTEEPSRVVFGRGRAVFLRSWPYAWRLFQQPGSAVRGKVGVTAVPHHPGYESAAALGGWQLGVNAFSRRPEAAERLVAFLTSPRGHAVLARAYGYAPPRRAPYHDPALLAEQPFLATLAPLLERARPRPVTPRYVAISQVLQSEFSAAVSGARPAAEAMAAAEARIAGIIAP